MAIIDYHRAIFNFLENYRHEHPEANLTYSLRKKNIDGRPRNLYLFTGNADYIFVGFYAPNNSKKKTRSIGVSFGYSSVTDSINRCTLEIGFNDPQLSSQQAIYQNIISQVGHDRFQLIGAKNYQLHYPDADWKNNLQTYLEQHRPIIDEVIRQAGATGVFHIPDKELEEDIKASSLIEQTSPLSDVKYWVFQGNPAQFRIVKALEDNAIQTWRVTAHSQQIKPSHKIILWVTGPQSGCYALAEVDSEVYTGTDEAGEQYYQLSESGGTASQRVKIKIIQNLWNLPVMKSDLQGIPAFAGFKGGSQGTNFTATKEQYDTILQLGLTINSVESPQQIMTINFPDLFSRYSKNIILYGPPGTGKTYETIDLAVDIIDGQIDNNHKANKVRFDQLRKNGQIEFVTFHQNYTYEDFVIGLKPDVESGSLKFEQREGIFYKLARLARQNFEASRTDSPTTVLRPFDDVLEEFMRPLTEGEESLDVPMASGIVFQIKKVGERSIFFEKSNGSLKHTLSISTLKRIYEGVQDIQPNGLKPYYLPLSEKLIELGHQINQYTPPKNYVLIIDEINRANMSRVFGELITLLEDDKRLGGDNELIVTLPSGELFSIPPNLYLIGTMNTADKSLALLDIALRRRFEFIGKYPNYEVLNGLAKSILERLNKAILSHKKSADFLIGHAYFISKSDGQLKAVLDNRVIPLLMEYFNGRTDMVERILDEAQISFIRNELTFQIEATDV